MTDTTIKPEASEVERVAQVICPFRYWQDVREPVKNKYRSIAKAAIAAMKPAQVDEERIRTAIFNTITIENPYAIFSVRNHLMREIFVAIRPYLRDTKPVLNDVEKIKKARDLIGNAPLGDYSSYQLISSMQAAVALLDMVIESIPKQETGA